MKLFVLVCVTVLLTLSGWAAQLNWYSTSTNLAVLRWDPWTNGSVMRYTAFWTPLTNTDTGTNFRTTTNWLMFADVNSTTTNASMAKVPTNTYITWVVTLPGGRQTPAIPPYTYTNSDGVKITNQPPSP